MKITKEDIEKYGTEDEKRLLEDVGSMSEDEERLTKFYPEIMEYFNRLVNVAEYTRNREQRRQELAALVGDILTNARKKN